MKVSNKFLLWDKGKRGSLNALKELGLMKEQGVIFYSLSISRKPFIFICFA